MDIGSAFTFMFDDEDWIKKIAIGGGIVFVGVLLSPILVGLLLLLPVGGYMIEVLKNVRDGQATPLPEWTDFGGLFKTGLMITVIAIIYYIPVIVLACGAGATQGFLGNADSDTAAALGFVAICLNCLQFLVSILVGFFMPAAFIRYARYETIGSAFQFAELWSFIRNNIGDYIIVFLLTWVAGIVAGFGLILCLIGIFFTMFWSYLVVGNLYGQLARKAV